jgi:intein/homing endonuclease
MLRETTEWKKRGSFPLNYNESDVAMKGRYKPVKLPQIITDDIAEEIGIHISDGSMGIDVVDYCGHEEDDGVYLRYYVLPLVKRLWGIKNVGWKAERDNKCLKLKVYSRRIVRFKERVLGLPRGSKEDIIIPEKLMRRRCWVNRLLTGLFDGDGSISFKSKAGLAHTYPVINYGSTSERLIRQVQDLLRKLGFIIPTKLSRTNERTLIIQINGNRNYERWMNVIGFNNPKHLTKVILYEKYDIVPPHTGLRERLKLIRGDIKISSMYPVKKLKTNIKRIQDKKILENLAYGENYIAELGRLTEFKEYCVAQTLQRLTKMGLVECVRYRRGSKKYYRVTQWGLSKMNRVETIVNRLREEFHLAV